MVNDPSKHGQCSFFLDTPPNLIQKDPCADSTGMLLRFAIKIKYLPTHQSDRYLRRGPYPRQIAMKYIQKVYRNAVMAVKPVWKSPTSKIRDRDGSRLPFAADLRTMTAATLIGAFLAAGAARAEEVSGPATIVNAGNLTINGEEIRLMGVDAPNIDQTCWDAEGQPWACGQQAAAALEGKTHDTPINCRGIRRDQSGRLLAICEVGGVNLNAWLVSEGWALAYRSQSLAFVPAEDTAREAAKGIWSGAFEPPSIWRRKHQPEPAL